MKKYFYSLLIRFGLFILPLFAQTAATAQSIDTLDLKQINNQAVYVFRIGEVGDTQSPLGHCTAFLPEGADFIFTAAHCFHQRAFKVISDKGETIVELKNNDYFYTESQFGLLDIFTVRNLSTDQIQKIQSISQLIHKTHIKSSANIYGYPQSRRNQPLSEVTCQHQTDFKDIFRLRVEDQLGVQSLTCQFRNEHEVIADNDLVKGISGGPALYSNGNIAVTFHYTNESDTGLPSIKTVSLNSITSLLTVEQAERKYQLQKKTIEQIKIPNAIRIDIDNFLVSDPSTLGQGLFFSKIIDIERKDVSTFYLLFDSSKRVE
ncbi:MAG: trypsin-like serine protease, partial [Bdellovibrionales bacterium]|nr:trypsin-like serine protease [Bdellovibrionales bacterium]